MYGTKRMIVANDWLTDNRSQSGPQTKQYLQ